MNIYACYTPSHHKMYWKYLSASIEYDLCLVAKKLPEMGDGSFRNPLWTTATRAKLECILEIMDLNVDDIFMFTDVDVQLFGPIVDMVTAKMQDMDIVTQADRKKDGSVMYCTGFMAIRNCEASRKVFEYTMGLMDEIDMYDDQDAFNEVVPDSDIRIDVFDRDEVWSHRKVWTPGVEMEIPKNIMVHHANWVVGIQNKIEQLQEVKNWWYGHHSTKEIRERRLGLRGRKELRKSLEKPAQDEQSPEDQTTCSQEEQCSDSEQCPPCPEPQPQQIPDHPEQRTT